MKKAILSFIAASILLSGAFTFYHKHQTQEAVRLIKAFYPESHPESDNHREITRRLAWIAAKVRMESKLQEENTSNGVLLIPQSQMPPKHIQDLVEKKIKIPNIHTPMCQVLNGAKFLAGSFISEAFAACDAQTVLMTHMNGTDTSTSFPDDSLSAHTVTANGDAQVDTALKQFGTGSVEMVAGTGYLTVPDHADWDFGTGDFTIDFWIEFDIIADGTHLIINRGDNDNYNFFHNNAGNFVWADGAKTESGGISINTWYHIAIVRNGTNLMFFKDGTQLGSATTNSTDYTSAQALTIGRHPACCYFLGHIDEFRVSKGIARWTANFTPPTSEYCASVTATDKMFLNFET